jgi:hypothetical protein
MSKPMPRHRILQPTSKLHLMVDRPGGKQRDSAIAEAARKLDEQRLPALKAMEGMIGDLEAATRGREALAPDELDHISRIADQIISHSTTYGLESLVRVGKGLCDLIGLFSKLGAMQMEPVLVHVLALRLFISSEKLQGPPPEAILEDLQKVAAHVAGKLPASQSPA